MKFIKSTKYFGRKFHHYTTPDRAAKILNEGLMLHKGVSGSGLQSNISAFKAEDDELSKNLNHWGKINDSIYKRSERLMKNNKHNLPFFFFDEKQYPRKYRQMNLLDGSGGNQGGMRKTPIVRIVGETTNNNELKLLPRSPVEFDSFDKHTFDPKPGTHASKLAEAGEVSISPKYDLDNSNKSLKLQLPFGSVTKHNYHDYIKDLKDVDPSRFDASDKYTRRVYNLYAKKNGLPTLKEPK